MLLYNNGQLNQFYQKCQKDKIIAIDTEFHRVDTYYPKLCLLQLANTSETIILDPVEESLNKNFIKKILYNTKIKKILHAGRQDVEIFFNMFGKVPRPIIDTQICIMPLGYSNSASYATICLDFLNVKINKSNQFIDWRVRPLSKDKINYAISDAKYLIPLYKIITSKLNALNRKLWIKEMHQRLLSENIFLNKKKLAWKKIDFNPKNNYELKLLKKVCETRENFAMKENVPVKRILSNSEIKKICNSNSRLSAKNTIIKRISNKLFKKEIVQILRNKPKDGDLINYKLKNKIDFKKREILKKLKNIILKKSQALNFHPNLIASNDDLREMVLGKKNIFNGWKYEIFKKECAELKKIL